MMKFFRNIRLFREYKKNILKNQEYLLEKWGLEINVFLELYTTIDISQAPQDIKEKYGLALSEYEIKTYMKNFIKDIEKLDLNELVNVYDIKKIDKEHFGIAFGFSQMNNKKLIIIRNMMYSLIIGGLLFFGVKIIL